MNGHPEVKAGELYVADANMTTNGAYSLPLDLAKSLQKEVAAGRLKLGAMYEEIQKQLGPKGITQALEASLCNFWNGPPFARRG
ncbi:MAG TPA: hypothetical protein VGY14_01515 [Methyloceanibacter sp.]|jgi:hypothetical protein|nr:hypothetical protein [Methyloceanibacter sp.]